MKRPRIKRPKSTRPRPKAHPAPPKPATPVPTGWMNTGFDDGTAAAHQEAQRRAALIAATSGYSGPPFPPPGMPPDAPRTTPVEVRTGGPLEITAGEFGAGPDVPEIDSIPPQETAASQFALDAEGRLDLVPDPPIVDDSQREFYREVRHKADALSALGHNQLGDLAKPIDRFRAALPADIQHASVTRIWSRGNSLRRHLKAHEIAVTSPEPDPARLSPGAAAMLGDLVDTFNVFVVGDPKGRELDQLRLGPQERSTAQAVTDAASSIVEAVRTTEGLATPTAVDALTESVEAAQNAPAGVDGDQTIDLSRKTAGNFVLALLRPVWTRIRAEPGFAWKEIRAGVYRNLPTKEGLASLAVLIAFIQQCAESLIAFVQQAFHNPTLIRIIEFISYIGVAQ